VASGVDLRVLRAWLALVLWVAFIAGMGGDQMSDHQTTSRFLGPLVDWLLPDLSEPQRDTLLYLIRKSAHAFEYAVLALLAHRALWLSWHKPLRLTSLISGAIVAVAALADEARQGLTFDRTSSGWDVLLDVTAGVLALAGVWFVRQHRATAKRGRTGRGET